MPTRTDEATEQRILEAIAGGASVAAVVAEFGICERTVRAVKYRHGLGHGRVGRPLNPNKRRFNKKVPTLPLTDAAAALVEAHVVFARRLARRVWREKGMPVDEMDEYESCALLALVRAGSRFQAVGTATFKTYAARYITGEISRHRMLAMRGDGWAFESWRQRGMIRGGQRVTWPLNPKNGEQMDFVGDVDESSVAAMARTVGISVLADAVDPVGELAKPDSSTRD